MGFFSKILGLDQAKELTKLGKAVTKIKEMLDGYESDYEIYRLLYASWMCKVGILDMIEKNGWLSNYQVYVQINGHLTKMTMMQVQMQTIFRLKNKVAQVADPELEENIDEILDGKEAFMMLDRRIPSVFKDDFMNY